jgi:hypothetical protein
MVVVVGKGAAWASITWESGNVWLDASVELTRDSCGDTTWPVIDKGARERDGQWPPEGAGPCHRRILKGLFWLQHPPVLSQDPRSPLCKCDSFIWQSRLCGFQFWIFIFSLKFFNLCDQRGEKSFWLYGHTFSYCTFHSNITLHSLFVVKKIFLREDCNNLLENT